MAYTENRSMVRTDSPEEEALLIEITSDDVIKTSTSDFWRKGKQSESVP